MKHLKKIIVHAGSLAVLAALVAGCGSGVEFVRQDMTEYPSKPSNAVVEVHDSEIMRPHVVIGTLTAGREMEASYNSNSTYDQVLESLKSYARKVGADALMNVRPVGDAGTVSSRVELTAVAVRYLNQANTVTN